MKADQREWYLKIGAAAAVGLLLLDWLVLTPAIASWHAQSERIALLQQKVDRGHELLRREDSIRERWADMQRANLPQDVSVAENQVFNAIGRWANKSGFPFPSITLQWQNHDEGFDTLECRAAGNGTQATIAKFIYEMEIDHLPVNLEECEITTRDTHGSQLALSARFSFLRLATAENTQ